MHLGLFLGPPLNWGRYSVQPPGAPAAEDPYSVRKPKLHRGTISAYNAKFFGGRPAGSMWPAGPCAGQGYRPPVSSPPPRPCRTPPPALSQAMWSPKVWSARKNLEKEDKWEDWPPVTGATAPTEDDEENWGDWQPSPSPPEKKARGNPSGAGSSTDVAKPSGASLLRQPLSP